MKKNNKKKCSHSIKYDKLIDLMLTGKVCARCNAKTFNVRNSVTLCFECYSALRRAQGIMYNVL